MSWGTRRRNTIVFIIFLIVAIPTAIIIANILIEEPTCFDAKRNGDETGIDCGGSCELQCDAEIIEPIVRWTRFFEVSPGIYNVVSYVENPNPDAGVKNAPYIFKLYDREGVLLQERKGSLEIKPKEIIPIVENTLFTNKLEPTRVSFNFTEKLIFTKGEPDDPVLIVKDEQLITPQEEPRIVSEIENLSILPVKDIMVVVIVYDLKDNAIASSSTVIKEIGKNQSAPVTFTWPIPFSSDVSRFEIIPIYDSPEIKN